MGRRVAYRDDQALSAEASGGPQPRRPTPSDAPQATGFTSPNSRRSATSERTLGGMHVSADRLLDVLRTDRFRITEARRAICGVIARSHGDHLTAATILEQANADGTTSVDQSTVYRTLETLEEGGVLTHTHLGHGASVYHLADEEAHQHFICDRCDLTVAVAAADLEEWIADIRTKSGFVVDPSHFALSGLCAVCAAKPV